MAKRRTRKQKEKASHLGYVTWTPGAASASNSKSVKREINTIKSPSLNSFNISKNSDVMAKDDYLGTMKHDIAKTLAITILILGFEIVLYWALQR